MIKNILSAGVVLAAFSVSSFAATATPGFYVSQDVKTHKCSVVDKAPDGKMAMDAGTKMYDSQANAEKAMAMLKVCGEAMAPAGAMAPAAKAAAPAMAPKGFYVESDVKTKKCMVTDKAADGKTMVDVGTKMYDSQANAEKAMANLAACK